MSMQIDGRQERRRRLAGRESDRMDLITGRLKYLPPSPPPPSPSSPSQFLNRQHQTHHRGHTHTGISPSFFYKEHYNYKDPDAGISSIDAVISKSKDEITSPFQKVVEASDEQSEEGNDTIMNNNQWCKFKNDVPIGEVNTANPNSTNSLSTVQKFTSIEEQQRKRSKTDHDQSSPSSSSFNNKRKFFTSKRINSSILASQNVRALSSLIIASLVVLLSSIDKAYLGGSESLFFPLEGWKPIYILVVTDVTIVIARMVMEIQKEGDIDEADEGREIIKEKGKENWDSAVKLLERGLVIYQAFRAIFIDFSVYLVFVICGLSFL